MIDDLSTADPCPLHEGQLEGVCLPCARARAANRAALDAMPESKARPASRSKKTSVQADNHIWRQRQDRIPKPPLHQEDID